MSELNLSLYHLAEGGDLLELFEMRAEMEASRLTAVGSEPAEITRQIEVVDEQIAAYMAALPAKVDSVRHVWKRIEVLITEAADEVKFQSRRGQHLKEDLERLKDYCQRCMELIEWKPGKPRKLEGHSGAIYLKGNGGRPAVEVYDESLVPDDLCTVTVTMNATSWAILASDDAYGSALRKCQAPRVPSLSLISARLSEACPKCAGLPMCRDSQKFGNLMQVDVTCSECGGSGKASVPGARLKPVGQHIECK